MRAVKRFSNKMKIFIAGFAALFVVVFSFLIMNIITGRITFGEVDAWDGESVATAFTSGNGTKENPYVISSPEEFILFKNSIEGLDYEAYQDKYYELANDLNFGNHQISSIGIKEEETEKFFKGNFNGKGHTINNLDITGSNIDDTLYYGLFSIVDNATITNLNINSYAINVEETNAKVVVGSLIGISRITLGEDLEKVVSNYNNISINRFNINCNSLNDESLISGLVSSIDTNTKISNIYITGSINTKNGTVNKLFNSINGTADNIFYSIDGDYSLYGDTDVDTSSIYADNGEIGSDFILGKLNDNSNESPFIWLYDGYYFLDEKEEIVENTTTDNTSFEFIPTFVAKDISEHATGVDGNAIHINNLTMDLNYYYGLNYTYKTDNTIPNGDNYNHYGTNNLAKVYIRYSGTDYVDNTLIGNVSNDEQYRDIYYYKYYPIVNGKITIDLIDNPWADRPNNKVFNGWITDDPNLSITLDVDRYVRVLTIPANGTGPYSVELKSHWIDGTVVNASNSTLDSVDSAGMKKLPSITERQYEDVSQYYITATIDVGDPYPPSAVDDNNNPLTGVCESQYSWWQIPCDFYMHPTSGEYVPGTTYYYYQYGRNRFRPATVNYVDVVIPKLRDTDQTAGYYRQFTLSRNQSRNGYVDNLANPLSGNCTANSCVVYKYMNYYDELGNINYGGTDDYYYLVTRDTNIYYNNEDTDLEAYSKPVTITGLNNGNTSINDLNIASGGVGLSSDVRIEYVRMTSSSSSTDSLSNRGYGIASRYHNLKIGRGLVIPANNRWGYEVHSAVSIIGGDASNVATGSSSSPEKYQIIIESGRYRNTSSVSYGTSTSYDIYVNSEVIYGSDIDRVLGNDDDLEIQYSTACSWGGKLNAGSANNTLCRTIVKTGQFGTSKYDYAAGIYVGGRAYGSMVGIRDVIVEGGWIYNLIGGPTDNRGNGTDPNRNKNQVIMNIKGGEIDMVVGGAGRSTTSGNRIINMTGGTVNYSVFGGSNGYSGNDSSDTYRGVLDGDTFVYVGGNATVGTTGTPDTLFGAERGSVFGIGNGNANYSKIGSARNSNVVIDGNATIKNNVYGGGNYGAVAATLTSGTTSTMIKIKGGSIAGSVYGGGNNNGSGTSSVTSTINIEMTGGQVANIYGGSRTKGTIYGGSTVNVVGGTVTNSIYGGGEGGYLNNNNPGTYVRDTVNVTIGNGTSTPAISGNVYGGSAYGTVNAINQNTNTTAAKTNVTVNSGTITGSVFGGGKGSSTYTPRVVGDITVNINNGSIGSVYGGMDASGAPSHGDVVFLNGGTVGNAYGGGNATGQTTTDIRLVGSTITGNVYGGSNQAGTVVTTNVRVTGGSATNIFGGNNLGGSSTTTNVTYTAGTITTSIYGGGNQAESTNTNVDINGAINIDSVYGGGNQAGVSNSTNVNIAKGTINGVYGGSNKTGTVGTTNVNVGPDTSNYYDDYTSGGSGLEVSFNYSFSSAQYQTSLYPEYQTIVDITPVFRNTTEEDFDEWSVTLNIPDSTFFVHDGDANIIVNGETYIWNQDDRWWGTNPIPAGSTYSPSLPLRVLFKGTENDFRLIYDLEAIDGNNGVHKATNDPNYVSPTQGGGINIGTIYGGNNIGGTVNISNVTLNNGTIGEIYGGGNQVGLTTSNVEITGGNITSIYGGSNRNGTVTTSNVRVGFGTDPINATNVFGGNNKGGTTTTANVIVNKGNIGTIYGGGDEAVTGSTNVIVNDATVGDIYGGGNAAGVNNDTSLELNGTIVSNNVYGGGNEGIVEGDTVVYVTNATINKNAYGGGNGSTAIVYGDSTINIDGTTTIGTASSEAPLAGCVFGSGNAASTGREAVGGSKATVNIVGGTIYGNVYGGPKMAIVYGTTETNIGSSAVNDSSLVEGNLFIRGTVFGGGESNATGSEVYDWNFISVTEGINVNINGDGYSNHSHTFKLNGSIFGSGNASSSSGPSNIYIKKLGTRTSPNQNISIQRASNLVIDESVIELFGATDRTNEYSDIEYSFNLIDKMTIKNNTVLLLQHNANLLKEFYSGVDVGGNLVPAAADVDEETGAVTRNVDNRVYMIPNQNLNVTITQDATAYGKVTGMTFFGMYKHESSNYDYGVYNDSLSAGDNANAGMAIIGGSYVLGLHSVGHNIKVDGFYSNYLSNDFSKVETRYIDPTKIGDTGYRWVIGLSAINYNVNLTATKYSSFGTNTLQMIDFADGNTIFDVLGVNVAGLESDVTLVDSNNVPKIALTETAANTVFGLSIKSETQEWTDYNTTKILSANGGDTSGDTQYVTDSKKTAPSLMFYLYHAKNISRATEIGTVVVMMQSAVPTSAIDYRIQLVTITINIDARLFTDADAYDAAITYDKRYEMPSTTSVNITNKSQFTAYFSMVSGSEFKDIYGENNTNYHALVTNNPLPVGTMITMLEYDADSTRPNYYYFKVSQAIYDASIIEFNRDNQCSYRLSNFIVMDSTSTTNTYNDATANLRYYSTDASFAYEEFLFIFDFKETNTTGQHLNNTILFEIRDEDDYNVMNVLGIRQPLMVFNKYDNSNALLTQTITDNNNYLYYNIPEEINYQTAINYNVTDNLQSVIDTNYESSNMGLNVAFYNEDGDEIVSSSLLSGTSITIDGVKHFADGDGVFRIKLAGKVSNLSKMISIVADKGLPTGNYLLRFTLFASSDGLHNSDVQGAHVLEYLVTVVNSDNSIVVDVDDKDKVVDGATSKNMNDSSTNTYTVTYTSDLNNPNLRLEVLKRDIDDIDSINYTPVTFNSLFSENLTAINSTEYSLNMDGENTKDFEFTLNSNLTSGTYRLVFKLYDNEQLIDDDIKYVIVKKKVSD